MRLHLSNDENASVILGRGVRLAARRCLWVNLMRRTMPARRFPMIVCRRRVDKQITLDCINRAAGGERGWKERGIQSPVILATCRLISQMSPVNTLRMFSLQ